MAHAADFALALRSTIAAAHSRNCDEAMLKSTDDNEFSLWQGTLPEQRSFLVEVLHWFHYRPSALKRSWAREEALTWEFLRAIKVLPNSLFLRPLLGKLADLSAKSRSAVEPLLAAQDVTVTSYPSLQLQGNKRNCRSDVGFGLRDTPTVWLEAKTAPFKDIDLHEQVIQQQQALASLFPDVPTAVITLLPADRALAGVPNLAWSDVVHWLQQGAVAMREVMSEEYRGGYELIATELIGRIVSHPNKLLRAGT